MSFIFGGDTGQTAESIARKRAVAQAMMQQGRGTPRNVGEGISSAASSIAGALLEKQGRKQADEGNAEAWAPIAEALAGRQQEPQALAAQGFNLDAIGESLDMPSRTGGSRSWRNNNPGNIEFGPFAERHGATGSDGRFAIFPDENAGRGAMESLLFGPSYANLSVTDAIGRYAPSSENDVGAYVGAVTGMEGITPDMPLSSMTPEQRAAFVDAMVTHEGWKPGEMAEPAMTASAMIDPLAPTAQVAQAMPPDMLPTLMQAAASGHLNQGQMAVVQALMQREMATPEKTSGMREYEMARQQGFEGSFLDYRTALAQAGRPGAPVVNVNTPSPDKFNEATGTALAKEAATVAEAGAQASANLRSVDRLEGLLSASPSGAQAAFQQMLGEFGIETDGLSNIQAAQALINKLVPEQRQPGTGPMSDADLALFKQSMPRIINTPGGNNLIIETLRGIANYDIQRGQIARDLQLGRMSFEKAIDAWSSLANPLEGFDPTAAATPSGRNDTGERQRLRFNSETGELEPVQ